MVVGSFILTFFAFWVGRGIAVVIVTAISTIFLYAAYGVPIWLGLTDRAVSLRPYQHLADIRKMVARSAYAQLGYSPLVLAGTLLGLVMVYLAPVMTALFAWGISQMAGWIAWIIMAVGFGLVVVAAIAVALMFARSREADKLVDHTFEVQSTAQTLLSQVQAAENGQRGFLITGDDDYLKRFEAAPARLLDAGCGPASMLRHLVRPERQVYGFDLTPEMVTEAQRSSLLSSTPAVAETLTNPLPVFRISNSGCLYFR